MCIRDSCKESVNFFLPFRPNRGSSTAWEISWNVINAVLVYNNCYQTGSLFEVLLDGLLDSLGFAELVASHKSKTTVKFKNKIDNYLIESLTFLYNSSSNS